MGTAQQTLDAQQQLLRVKRLAQVIVGAGLQPLDALSPGAARGEDQHRSNQATGAPFTQHLKPRFARQAEVENDQVIGLSGALVGRITAIGQPVHGVALLGQAGE